MRNLDRYRALLDRCSIAAALTIIGERWTLLILRGAFDGLRHFEEFQATLGIARNILASRLARLVANGVFERTPDPNDRRRIAYRLTEKGRSLLPVLMSLKQWGERWVCPEQGGPMLVDRQTRRPIAVIRVRSADGRPLALKDLLWVERNEVETAPVNEDRPRVS